MGTGIDYTSSTHLLKKYEQPAMRQREHTARPRFSTCWLREKTQMARDLGLHTSQKYLRALTQNSDVRQFYDFLQNSNFPINFLELNFLTQTSTRFARNRLGGLSAENSSSTVF